MNATVAFWRPIDDMGSTLTEQRPEAFDRGLEASVYGGTGRGGGEEASLGRLPQRGYIVPLGEQEYADILPRPVPPGQARVQGESIGQFVVQAPHRRLLDTTSI